MFLFYSLIYLLLLTFFLPYEFLKRPSSLRKRWLKEKFGFIELAPHIRHSSIWLHAVSVGEVMSAIPFIKALKRQDPNLSFIVSTITDTGQKVANENLKEMAEIIYMPFDIKFILKNALKRIRPLLFITMETELWPNIFRVMKQEGVFSVIVNGRVSLSSFKGYEMIRVFIKKVLKDIDLFCMQEDIYAKRIIGLGAMEGRVKVTGNLKFDINISTQIPLWADDLKGPVIVAGSTHKGEEEIILSAFSHLIKEFPSLNLILAPRHPERFKEVEGLIKSRGLSFIRRSAISTERNLSPIILLDTIGELFSTYSRAEIAILGGSFIPHGGHNPLEPAYWGKPVICGEHMENFPFVKEFLKENGIVMTDEKGLEPIVKELLGSPQRRYEIGNKAKELCLKKTGAVNKTIGVIEETFNLMRACSRK